MPPRDFVAGGIRRFPRVEEWWISALASMLRFWHTLLYRRAWGAARSRYGKIGMDTDLLVEEVRKARHMIAAFYGNDLRAIAEAAARGFSDFKPAEIDRDAFGITTPEPFARETDSPRFTVPVPAPA